MGSHEAPAGMVIDWDVPIPMDDGVVVRADVFRPAGGGRHPVVLSYGPYAKGLSFQEGYPDAWTALVRAHPEVLEGSSGRYQAWEVVDPERWVPDGYACVRVDARGWGRSPGFADPWSARETRDLYQCVEWAARQPWSSGRIGLAGISYFAINQWLVAGLQPPHLRAMIPWEGLADFYRDFCYHGGIKATSPKTWYERVVASVQHGLGARGPVNPNTGELACGPKTLSDGELEANRADYLAALAGERLHSKFWERYSPDLTRISVPFLSAGNWGGAGMHLRGNVEAFVHAPSQHKWLEIHTGEHWGEFYSDYGIGLQKRFFDHFLKGLDNGWAEQPRVMLRVRTVDGFTERTGDRWPLPQTQWTRLYLDATTRSLGRALVGSPAQVEFDALGDGVTFLTPPLESDLEFAGPLAARLFVSSSTTDADLFLVVRAFDPDGDEVVFQGAVDPHTPVAQGWLRASHRKLDPVRSTAYRPYHPHDEVQPLAPGAVYQLDVEIWPSSLKLPSGYRLGLTVRGKDYEYRDGQDAGAQLSHFKGKTMRGCGIYLHDDAVDRPASVFGGRTTIHTSPERPCHLLLPVIPTEA